MTLAEIYNIISIVAFAIAGIAFIVAVAMWINYRIPKIIGDLSGRTAKKSIEQRRTHNEKTGAKSYRPTPVAVERGTLTDSIEHSEKLKKDKKKSGKLEKAEKSANSGKLEQNGKSEKLEKTEKKANSGKLEKNGKSGKLDKNAQKANQPAPKADNVPTVLTSSLATDVLSDPSEGTTVLEGAKTSEGTTVLSEGTTVLADEGTTVLNQQGTGEMKKSAKFVLVENIFLMASDEIV